MRRGKHADDAPESKNLKVHAQVNGFWSLTQLLTKLDGKAMHLQTRASHDEHQIVKLSA